MIHLQAHHLGSRSPTLPGVTARERRCLYQSAGVEHAGKRSTKNQKPGSELHGIVNPSIIDSSPTNQIGIHKE
jgi:hypothetical protein